MSNRLDQFVYQALTAGASEEEIEACLVDNDWEPGEVKTALASYRGVAFGQPVPKPKRYVSPAEAFSMLLMFAALYVSSWALGALLFQIVAHFFPDASAYYRGASQTTVRWSIAWLCVMFPLFLWMARKHHALTRSNAQHKHSPLRKWLTYGTLLVAALTLLGDSVFLLYSVLAGELTARFLLKALSLAGIAVSVFAYYLMDLRSADRATDSRQSIEAVEKRSSRRSQVFAIACSIVVVVALILGVSIGGSPPQARMEQLDQARLNDLRSLSGAIEQFYALRKSLPAALAELAGERVASSVALEDTDGVLYRYRVTGERTYSLCALFGMASSLPAGESSNRIRGFWEHSAGEQCFDFEVEAKGDSSN